jgi:hypothetical protein
MIKNALGREFKIDSLFVRTTDSEISVSRYERNKVPKSIFSAMAARKRQKPVAREIIKSERANNWTHQVEEERYH